MFKKVFGNDKELDVGSLNHLIRVGNKILTIGFFMIIVSLVLLGTYIVKEWRVLKFIGDILGVLSPMFIGFLIAWLFEPLVTKIEKYKVPRVVGCIFVYLLILFGLFSIGYFFIPSLASQIKDFVAILPEIFDELAEFIVGVINKFNLNTVVDVKSVKSGITEFISNYGGNFVSVLPSVILKTGKSIVSVGIDSALGLMIGFYILYDFNKVTKYMEKLLPDSWHSGFKELAMRINTSLRSYIQGLLLIMLLVFITQSIGLSLAGLKAPILFALFCAVTDVIPYFGPYIGAIPAIIVGLTISPLTGLCVLVSIIIVQQLENNFYEPLIMGHTMKLHPVTIMCGLLIFQHFFGIIGMVVATPVIACIKVLAGFVKERIVEYKDDKENKDNRDNIDNKTVIKA